MLFSLAGTAISPSVRRLSPGHNTTSVPNGGCPRANFALIIIPNRPGQDNGELMFILSFNHLINAAGRTCTFYRSPSYWCCRPWQLMGIYAVQGIFLLFILSFYRFHLSTAFSAWRADVVDLPLRTSPFISDALNHGGELCPRVSS